MIRNFHSILLISVSSCPLLAGTVMITSVPDEEHAMQPLTSLAGIPLAAGTQVLVGAFPGLSDSQILDIASQGGLLQISASFVSFGSPCLIGQGVDGATGGFEIAVNDSGDSATWIGETVSLLIKRENGEFLVARFADKVFEAESETGLEPLLSLHLAEARLIVGNRVGDAQLTTSPAPPIGSFNTWLAGFPTITDPTLKLPSADADSDGRSNFLEYATGGDPAASGDPSPCSLQPNPEGGYWVRFTRVPGIGSIRYQLESSEDMKLPWLEAEGSIEPDSENPASMRLRLTAPLPPSGFFRLNVNVESAP